MSAVLSVKGLHVSYAGHPVVDVRALSVASGEVVGIVGANGAGKSTLVNAIAGWSRSKPSVACELALGDQDIGRWSPHKRARHGLLLVPESKLVFASLSVEENLAPPSRADTGDSTRRFYSRDDIYAMFPRLNERRRHLGSQLSGGERQMLGIGRALMLGPKVLMVDEPSIGLSPKLTQQVLRTLRELADAGLGILMAEQNVRAAVDVVDRLIVLERGSVVLEGPTAEVKNHPRVAQAYLGGTAP